MRDFCGPLETTSEEHLDRFSRFVWYPTARQGRLNQWAHWARGQGPRIFFRFEGSPTDSGENFF